MATRPANMVITDITISFTSFPHAPTDLDSNHWSRIEKDLYLHRGKTRTAWLCAQWKRKEDLTEEDTAVTCVSVDRTKHDEPWESRPGGLWLLRCQNQHNHGEFVTDVDVLFGTDAIDPRPGWTLERTALVLDGKPDLPLPRITVKHGRSKSNPDIRLRPKEDGKFKIVQISDLHFGTGPGICEDAIDAHESPVPAFEADPRSVKFMGDTLDIEKPDLVVLTGDQVEFGKAPDTQTAIFKYAAPLIERCIPFAVVFGNHDDEGPPSLPRTSQMALLQSLPFCVSQPGPEEIDGVGNYHLEIAHASSQFFPLTLFFLDSHNRLPVKGEVYDWIKQSQIDWFKATSQKLRKTHSLSEDLLSLAFIHIPLPEYSESGLILTAGRKREEVMSPLFNSHFYDALVEEGVAALSCGHDHVNDYCALRAEKQGPHSRFGPWLCYGGGSGFGGYGGYGGYHRRVRVFNIDMKTERVETWKRVEYRDGKIDELVLVNEGVVVAPRGSQEH